LYFPTNAPESLFLLPHTVIFFVKLPQYDFRHVAERALHISNVYVGAHGYATVQSQLPIASLALSFQTV
jgi:hypothetical protein